MEEEEIFWIVIAVAIMMAAVSDWPLGIAIVASKTWRNYLQKQLLFRFMRGCHNPICVSKSLPVSR